MNETLKQQLLELRSKSINNLEKVRILSTEVAYDTSLLKALMQEAIRLKEKDTIEACLELYWLNPHRHLLEEEFNALLILPDHMEHQKLLFHLQTQLKYKSSIKYIRILLEKDFQKFFAYTGSEDYVIAQWMSWALVGIGTTEAKNLILEYSQSEVEGIRKQMIYRWNKING